MDEIYQIEIQSKIGYESFIGEIRTLYSRMGIENNARNTNGVMWMNGNQH